MTLKMLLQNLRSAVCNLFSNKKNQKPLSFQMPFDYLQPLDKNVLMMRLFNATHSGAMLLMAPWLGAHFFKDETSGLQLIYMYGLLSISAISRPLGCMAAGYWLHRFGLNKLLSYIGFGTVLGHIGVFALCIQYQTGAIIIALFVSFRFIQSISASAEAAVVPLLLSSHVKPQYTYKTGSYLELMTMVGVVLSSLNASYAMPGSLACPIGLGLLSLFGVAICASRLHLLNMKDIFFKRTMMQHSEQSQEMQEQLVKEVKSKTSFFKLSLKDLRESKKQIVAFTLLAGVGQLTYLFAFIVLNTYIPLFSQNKAHVLVEHNIWLMGLDIALIMILPYVLKNVSAKHIVAYALCALTILMAFLGVSPALYLTETYYVIVRALIVFFGVALLIPHLSLIQMILPACDMSSKNILIIGLSKALGSSIFGKITPVLGALWAHYFQNLIGVGFFAAIICFITHYVLKEILSKDQEKQAG